MDPSSPRRIKLDDLGRFMIDHQVCGAGFDVSHPQGIGGGLMTTTCRGCGAKYEYSGTVFAREAKRKAEAAPAEPTVAASHLTAVPVPSAPPNVIRGRLTAVPPAAPLVDQPPEPVDGTPDIPDIETPELPTVVPVGPPPPSRTEEPEPRETKRSKRSRKRASEADARPPAPKPGPAPMQTGGRGIRRVAAIVALIAVIAAGAALVLTQIRSSDSEPVPTPSTFPGTDQGAAGASGSGNQDASAGSSASQGAAQGSGSIRTISGADFTVRAPSSWSESVKNGQMTLRPKGSDAATVEIISEPIKPGDAAGAPQDIAKFLTGRDPSAQTSPPSVHPVAGRPGFVVQAKGSQYTQDATGSVSGKSLLLAIRTTRNNAPSKLRRQAFAIAASLKPR